MDRVARFDTWVYAKEVADHLEGAFISAHPNGLKGWAINFGYNPDGSLRFLMESDYRRWVGGL